MPLRETHVIRAVVRWSFAICLAGAMASCSSSSPAGSPPEGPPPSPDALAGDWMLETRTGDQSVEGRLHFSFTRGVLAGSVYDAEGNELEMKGLSLKGTKISWDAGSRHYEGTAGAFAMKGTISRSSRREAGEDESAEPPPGRPSGGGYAGGRFGGGGRRGYGRGRGRESATKVTWSAYKSSAASPTPAAAPTPSSR